MEIAGEPLFDTLRTKEQLAYDVSGSLRDSNGILAYTINVNSQENKFSVDHVDQRIERFREELVGIIERLSDEDFAQFKDSLAKAKLTMDNTLEDEIKRNWAEITTGEYIFDRAQREVEVLGSITKEEVLSFWRKYSGANERKLSIQVIGDSNARAQRDEAEPVDDSVTDFDNLQYVDFTTGNPGFLVKDVMEFKKSLEVYLIAKTNPDEK